MLDASAFACLSAAARFAPAAPRAFVDFCAWLGVTLTPAQRVIALVAFDGKRLEELLAADARLAREMFGAGQVEHATGATRRIFAAVCGARGGKTYTLAALRILHLGLTVPLDLLAPGEVASGPILAPDKDLAGQALNYVKGAVDSSPELRALLVKEPTTEALELGRDGRQVEIVVRAASAKGRTGRGRSLIGAVLDEACFFYDDTYQVNDEEIYRALKPRVLPGGQLIVCSTPWAQSGILYELFADNHPEPERAGLVAQPRCRGTALAAHAPTLLLRDEPSLRQLVREEEERDPENAAREYGARFMSISAATFFDPPAIEAAIRPALTLPRLPVAGELVSSGADYAFARNSSGLVIVHRTEAGRYVVGEVLEAKPEPGAPLKPSTIVRQFAAAVDMHRGSYTMADGHYRETVHEWMPAHQTFVDAPADPTVPFVHARALLREGLVDLPNHARLLRQLREVKSRPMSGGKVKIVLPMWRTGEHGDLVSCFVLALYQAANGELVAPVPPKPGTDAWEDAAREERRKMHEGKASRPWWKK
jgi:hypothetical protein